MTKLIIKHPKLGLTHKNLALRMINGALHRNNQGKIVRFRTQKQALGYASCNFKTNKFPRLTVLM